ncbi:hypothetical protein B0H66DRAFT_271826 [Apodospora peruviana]|uniref:AAA+ ATPase domain-containing protein n=1 Tax=Apodospora peruviana TaxID=516989 RepID=A0AAE0HZQ8_9PEZI|nr:hypothetical protein B0H66DRAFT_271826 [Apodospora peruviana]
MMGDAIRNPTKDSTPIPETSLPASDPIEDGPQERDPEGPTSAVDVAKAREVTVTGEAAGDKESTNGPPPEVKNDRENLPAKSTEACMELANGVLSLLGQLGPLRADLTQDTTNHMRKLATMAIDLRYSLPQEAKKSRKQRPKRVFRCRVARCLMDIWKFKSSRVFDGAIIQAFYHQYPLFPSTSEPLQSNTLDSPSPEPHRLKFVTELTNDRKNLQRILINSYDIHRELETIMGVTMEFPIIIAPPFKVLVKFLPQLRQRLANLQAEQTGLDAARERIQELVESDNQEVGQRGTDRAEAKNDQSETEDEDDDDSQSSSDSSNPEPYYDPEENSSISHLKLLLDFIDQDLRDIIALRAEIAAGTLTEIAFEDLWHLFEPGELVFVSRGPNQQLLKVCGTTGGQIQLRNYNKEEADRLGLNRLRMPPPRYEPDRPTDILREDASGVGVWTPFTVDCYAMGYDGSEVGPLDICKRIRHYSGKRAITNLDIYPLRFHADSGALLQRMEDRGRKVLASYGHKRYKGATINQAGDETFEDISSDVFIDMKMYFHTGLKPNYGHNLTLGPPPPDNARRMKLGQLLKTKPNPTETSEVHGRNMSGHEVDTKLSEDFMASNRSGLEITKPEVAALSPSHLQLLQYPVIGYAFRYRKWFFLDIDLLEDIDLELESRESGFNELVIPKRYRDLLVALVDNHISGGQEGVDLTDKNTHNNQIDLVKGKGQGVIVLLHGPPGSGKTSTAETIAAYTKRPLYSLTTGDIGTNPQQAERHLIEHTRRADRWGCVLLLDEADVFLMQRDWEKVDRNALVSVFLRELEYYSGIMFLTTNRPGVLDEAFKSRIHITLNYKGVDLESTKAMWTNILNRLERDNKTNDVKVAFNRDELLDFAERHYRQYYKEGATWNGRNIRNAFRTALALGHHERVRMLRDEGVTPAQAARSGKKKWMRVRLTKTNFKKIAKTAYEFEEYIVNLRGRDSDKARDGEVRDDLFDMIGEAVHQARKDYSAGTKGKGRQDGGGHGKMSTSLRAAVGGGSGGKGKGGVKEKTNIGGVDFAYDEDEDEDEDDDEEFSDNE